jgi:hypothetical protein
LSSLHKNEPSSLSPVPFGAFLINTNASAFAAAEIKFDALVIAAVPADVTAYEN